MDGITIGDGAVLANNSHVVKDVDNYEIVGGNPATHIKYRFDPIHVDRLMKIRWWEFSDTIIAKYLDLLCNDNIELFLNEFEKENYTQSSY